MKHFYFLIFLLLGYTASSQVSFNDDFESYNIGAAVGPQSTNWTTWSGTEGGTEDAKVVSDKAYSGTKSIYFVSTAATGGPQDVVVPFTDLYTNGVFEIGMKFYVPSGKTAYFNLQGDKTIGTVWSLDVNFNADKTVALTGGGAALTSGTYNQDEWVEFKVKGNISTNLWTASVGGKSLGTFKLATNKVASIDLYPANANAQFYVDDFYYSHEPFTPKLNDVAISSISVPARDLTGFASPLAVELVNMGSNTITAANVEVQYGGNTITKNLTNLSIESLKSQVISLDQDLSFLAGANPIIVNVTMTGIADDDASNNATSSNLTGVTPAVDKIVIAEEATGTWCGWCPRGAVALDKLSKKYPDHFIGIAVHNADPMTVTEYDAGIRSLSGFEGFPSATVGRTSIIDPSAIENDFFARIDDNTRVKLKIGAEYDESTRILKLSPTISFKSNVNGQFKIALVIAEDSVRGTATGYAQTNYYAGGANGPMGGYELLPATVPASMMTYNHVARAIVGGFRGTNLPKNSYKTNDEVLMNFEVELPAGLNLENVHLIPIIFANTTLVENGLQVKFEDAIEEGFTVGANDVIINRDIKLYPNPFALTSIVELDLDQSVEVSIEILDVTGKIVGNKNYGKLSGKQELVINGHLLQNGTYFAKIKAGEEFISKTFVIQK